MALLTAQAQGELRSDQRPETELGFVPLVGGDTDIGIGVGFLGSLARVDPAVKPYRWRIESVAFISFKKTRDGPIGAPYQDIFVMATLPGLWGGRGRLELRPSHTRETNLRYYGVGNAAAAPDEKVPSRDFYGRVHPALAARLRLRVAGPVHVSLGTSYARNWISYDPASTLALDVQSSDPEVRSLVRVQQNFGMHMVETGIDFDRRDDEIAPERGQYHTAKVRVASGGSGAQPFEYVQAGVITRFYVPLARGRLVLATRQVVDGLFGAPPFYELGRFAEDTSAIGGANGVRGVPSDRYLGKLKLFGNFELRWTVKRLSIRRSEYTLGAVAFVDGGRVWTDFRSRPELDGTGLGLKVGAGGGLRLQKGRTFVIRADVAWSPDARPVGGYFLAGHLF